MSDYNHVTLVGNLTSKPETQTINGKCRTTFTIAVHRDFKVNGEEVTDFININAWGKLAEICEQYLDKGKKVLVDGRLQIREYTDKDEKKWFTEVIADTMKILSPKASS